MLRKRKSQNIIRALLKSECCGSIAAKKQKPDPRDLWGSFFKENTADLFLPDLINRLLFTMKKICGFINRYRLHENSAFSADTENYSDGKL